MKKGRKQKKRVLVAPLNWGLGHATRCIPIINELQYQGVEVIIASDGNALDFLKKEYPKLVFVKLPAYNVTYKTSNMTWNIASQSLKIAFAMFREFIVLQRLIKQFDVKAVIVDNRYGCWTWQVPVVFITHQVKIKIPNSFLQYITNQVNRFVLQLFDKVWIPDLPNEPNLAGDLAHHHSLRNAFYIGVLSRMNPLPIEQKYDIGIVLSGPEPQRTYLEIKLLKEIREYIRKHPNIDILFVKGKVGKQEKAFDGNVEIHGYLTSKELNEKMAACNLIITRSGYSTIMDLVTINKKAILIPTPSQTEQEYLADLYQQQGMFYTASQSEFELEEALTKSESYHGCSDVFQQKTLLEEEIKSFLSTLL